MLSLVNDIENSIIESIADGEGIRLVVFCCGCNHYCSNCQNPESWNINIGTYYDITTISDYIVDLYNKNDKLYSGITFSGGDPIYQKEEVLNLIMNIKSRLKDINIWLYTGYTYEEIKDLEILKHIDVLVDGKFDINKKYPRVSYRGSNNQRLIYLENGNVKRIG